MIPRPAWDTLEQEAAFYLSRLIQFDTTNPPGHEWPLLQYLAELFTHEGFDPVLMETAPDRGNLVVRMKGNGRKRPLMLSSHVDVVPAEASLWRHPPFSGHIDEEGTIWGRGAVDMKQMTVMTMLLLFLLQREGVVLDRDLVFVAVSDEEAGCEWGSRWLVRHRPELIADCEYALNEVGGFSLYLNGRCYYPIQVAEKGFCWLKIRAEGPAGHGAMPHPDNAVVKLARAVERLGTHRLPYHKTPIVEGFISTLAQHQAAPVAQALKGLLHAATEPLILNNLLDPAKARGFAAMLHNTASPTMLQAGNKVNVIPPWAEVIVDGRILPGQSTWGFVQEIRDLIGPGYSIEILQSASPLVMETANACLQSIAKVLKRHDPPGIPVPYMVPGFTDAQSYAELGIPCYGFCPLKLEPEIVFNELFHGHNERVSQKALRFGLQVLFDLVQEL